MFPSYLAEFVQSTQRILLLQGPLGPFFADFADWLRQTHGKEVFKVNFNGGDQLFYPETEQVFNYTQSKVAFEDYVIQLLEAHQIDAVVCFGDCRAYHRIAKQVCEKHRNKPAFWVFEEGYLRPHYITFEKSGVNGFSLLSKHPDVYRNAYIHLPVPMPPETVASGFRPMAWQATRYYIALYRQRGQFPYYRHHRQNKFWVYAAAWVRSGLKKVYCHYSEQSFIKKIRRGDLGDFFVVPLQVHNDSQVRVHSDIKSVAAFLRTVLFSFSRHAPMTSQLVIKHHPMDRGFVNYQKLIQKFIRHYHLEGRIHYVFDVPLPELMRQGKGMVLLNSTSGLSAMIHHMPVKVLGHAHYDMAGLTDQQPLATFWHVPVPPNSTLFNAYRLYLLHRTQLNGNFHGRVVWPRVLK